MNPNLTIGLLLSPKDYYLFPSWIRNHDGIASKITIGLDAEHDDDAGLWSFMYLQGQFRSKINTISCPLNNDFATARNKILEQCDTLLMLFLDADELLMPGTKERLSMFVHDIQYSSVQCYSFERINVFNRTFQDYPNHHACLMKKDVRYINTSPHIDASPGCHEVPNGYTVKENFQILHLKENWTGNFRHKGYTDSNNSAAMADVEAKARKTQFGPPRPIEPKIQILREDRDPDTLKRDIR